MKKGSLYLESGEIFSGVYGGGEPRAGEVVFNTSHSGYEEIATDPSYFSQIVVMTAPQQGNYGVSDDVWESQQAWIQGFVCVQMQSSKRDSAWSKRLNDFKIPFLSEVDTRRLVLQLRSAGTMRGAIIDSQDRRAVVEHSLKLFAELPSPESDWTRHVCTKEAYSLEGASPQGPQLALIDFGTKKNIIRELLKRARSIKVYPSGVTAHEILIDKPGGVILSNGPGDPFYVKKGIETVKELIGHVPLFGICMGHQVLSLALGGSTYKLKYGHRGSNHPIQDHLLNTVYVTSQNHGYAVSAEGLPSSVQISHWNLNDNTVAGIMSRSLHCMSVQFHPESHPGPHDSASLFDYFIEWTL